MGYSPDVYLREKTATLREFLAESAPSVTLSWNPAPSPIAYRNRIRIRVVEGRPVFFNPHKANECMVLHPSVREGLERVREVAATSPGVLAPFAHAEIRERDMNGKWAFWMAPLPSAAESDVQRARDTWQERLSDAWVGVPGLGPIPMQKKRISDLAWTYVPLRLHANQQCSQCVACRPDPCIGKRTGNRILR
jgi:hypothetical protein